jgi:hypothetical protein
MRNTTNTHTVVKALTAHGIVVPPDAQGRVATMCPRCLERRSLTVRIEPAGFSATCDNCGYTVERPDYDWPCPYQAEQERYASRLLTWKTL